MEGKKLQQRDIICVAGGGPCREHGGRGPSLPCVLRRAAQRLHDPRQSSVNARMS